MPLKFHPDGLMVECSKEEWDKYEPLLLKHGFHKKSRGILDPVGTRYMVEFRDSPNINKVLLNPSILHYIGVKIDDVPVMASWREAR